MRLFVGIDPGRSGAIAVVDATGAALGTILLKETDQDVWEWMLKMLGIGATARPGHFAVLERVGAMPRQGLSSTFKFGTSYGFCRGLLTANQIAYEEATPVSWQTAMKCRTKGDKNVTKAAAQRLFPTVKITHANADALLIAEYARRTWFTRSAGTHERGAKVDQ